MNAYDMVNKATKGQKHIMTPRVLRIGKVRDLAYELSTGDVLLYEKRTGKTLDNGTLFGVTVVRIKDGEPVIDHDLSRAFHSLEDAERYIDNAFHDR